MHISNIYEDKELDKGGTYKKFLLVRQEGKWQVRRNIDHYNLDKIISLGYSVQSPIAVRFRRWATQRLHEYIQKGFTPAILQAPCSHTLPILMSMLRSRQKAA